MSDHFDRLVKMGFVLAGAWKRSELGIRYELNELATARNVLYAFVVENEVMYVGKTVMSLGHRMQRYKTPASSPKSGGTTNIRNNQNVRLCLDQLNEVRIFALPDNGLLHYGGFHVNLAAGLEDALVNDLAPPWNGGKKESAHQELEPTIMVPGEQ